MISKLFKKNSKSPKLSSSFTPTPIIEVKTLSFKHDSLHVLKDVSFTINRGDFVAIMGPNGAGKSTLIKILVKLLEFKNFKKHISISGKIAYIPQKFNQDSQFPTTVKELLALECCKCDHRNKVVQSLRLEGLEHKQFKHLSGGQQQRVFVALALLNNPEILILDEPTVGVDSNTQEEFYKLLHELNTHNNLTILLITHDTSMVSNYVTRILCIGNKTIIEEPIKASLEENKIHSVIDKIYPKSFQKVKHDHSCSHGHSHKHHHHH